MKRWFLGIGVVAAVTIAASSAFAGGINMAWSKCAGEGTGTQDRAFACNTNSGSNQLVLSFILDTDVSAANGAQASGLEFVIDLISTSAPLPNWWQMKNVGTCRQLAINANGTFDAANVVCQDWGAGAETSAFAAYSQTAPPGGWSISPSDESQHARALSVSAVPPTGLVDLFANTEYFGINVTISNTKTVGTGACAGCTDPVCLVLNSIKVTTPLGGTFDVKLTTGTSPGSNICTWQGTGANCAAVPTRNRTWGAVKSLYR